MQDNRSPLTLLSKQYSYVCGIYVSFFIISTIALRWYNSRGASFFCLEVYLPEWTQIFNGIAVGGSCGSLLIQLSRLIMTESGINTRSAVITLLAITSVSATSQILTLIGHHNTACIDVFGIKSPLMQWPEWISTVPMMFYLCIAMDTTKTALTYDDWGILSNAFLTIAVGFCTNWGFPFEASVTFLVLSTSSMLVAIIFLYRQSCECNNKSKVGFENPSPMTNLVESIAQRKRICALYLAFALPLFPIVYLSSMFGLFSADVAYAMTQVLNFSVKMLYCFTTMDSYIEILDPNKQELILEKRANESRRSFLRYVFHEVRVPLNSITMGIDILSSTPMLSSEDLETLKMMKEASGFMTETLNDVLSIQKIEEGKLDLQYERFSIKAMVSAASLSLKGQFNSKNLRLDIDLPDDLPANVLGDRFRLEHVVVNFLSNAVKFSESGSKICIRVRCEMKEKAIITVSVIDEGIGISSEDQKKLFTPYMQIRPGELQQGRGTGIGLAICREIVHIHGGTIGVHSTPKAVALASDPPIKSGSEFYFTIPFVVVSGSFDSNDDEVESTDVNSNSNSNSNSSTKNSSNSSNSNTIDRNERNSVIMKQQSSQQSIATGDSISGNKTMLTSPSTSTKSKKCLVVDDVLSNRKLLANLLMKRGIECVLLCDGNDAVDEIRKNCHKYDFIFMDNLMIKMCGIDATKIIRSELGFDNVIIGLTGNAMDEDKLEYINAGADIVMTKPLKVEQLDALMMHFAQFGVKTVRLDTSSSAYKSLQQIMNKQ